MFASVFHNCLVSELHNCCHHCHCPVKAQRATGCYIKPRYSNADAAVSCNLMAKKVARSWLSVLKRAFRSTKSGEKSRRKEKGAGHEDHEEDKIERRRYVYDDKSAKLDAFMKFSAAGTVDDGDEATVAPLSAGMRYHGGKERASVIIQTAFRGYLARRALGALKGLVKLQALIRGQNARRKAERKLRCMQALIRVQTQVLDQRTRLSLSHDSTRRSTYNDSEYVHRKSMSRNSVSVADDYSNQHFVSSARDDRKRDHFLRRKVPEARENNSFQTFPQQVWMSGGVYENPDTDTDHLGPRLFRCIDGTPCYPIETNGSTDHRPDFIKTVEIDTYSPNPVSKFNPKQTHFPKLQKSPSLPFPSISPLKSRPAYPNWAQDSHPRATTTPKHRSGVPGYMATTESRNARMRSHSAPKQRFSSERERVWTFKNTGLAPFPEGRFGPFADLRSPGLSKFSLAHFSGSEHQSVYSSCCTESVVDFNTSPSSKSDIRRRFRS